MNWIFIIYIIILIYYIWKVSKHNTLYVFNPIVTLYLAFATSNIYPLVTYGNPLPRNIINVTYITCIINTIFMLVYRKQFLQKVRIIPDDNLTIYAPTRRNVMWVFLGIIISTGFYTGVTQMLLAGGDVEDLRMTSDIGMGFVRAVPTFGISYLAMEYFIINKNLSFWKAGTIGLSLGLVLFLATAARGGVLTYVMCFFVWVNLRYRGFKWYEYFAIFYLLKPVIATILKMIRSANIIELVEFRLFEHEQMIFGANTVRLAEYMDMSQEYLWGTSYAYPIFRIIPRFIWPDKPVAIDYIYKEMVGLEFEGGGIYTTADFDMFLNFGYFYVIEYVLWLLLVHWMYQKLINSDTKFANKMLICMLLLGGFSIGALIQNIQLYFLFLLIFYFINRKWRVI